MGTWVKSADQLTRRTADRSVRCGGKVSRIGLEQPKAKVQLRPPYVPSPPMELGAPSVGAYH
jgi:hypothetical protein